MKIIIILLFIILSLYGNKSCDYIKNINILKTGKKDVHCIYKIMIKDIKKKLPLQVSGMAELVDIELNQQNEIHYYNIVNSDIFDFFISGIDVIESDSKDNICKSQLMAHTFKNGGSLVYHYINSDNYKNFKTIKINKCK